MLVIDDDEYPLTVEDIMKIGKGPAYDKRRKIEKCLQSMAEASTQPWHDQIVAMDLNRGSPNFDGGFEAVVRKYQP